MLIWNAMGSLNFVLQMNPEMVESYRETEQAIIIGRPLWATTGFVFAVFGGTIGCVFLLLKKAFALQIFIVSLVGVVVTQIHALSLGIDFSFGEIAGIVLMPIVVAAFLVWYSIWTKAKGWVT